MIQSTEREVTGRSGPLAVRIWSSADDAAPAPGWLAVVLHSYAEHVDRYRWLAEQLVDAGAVVCAPDQAGHGRAPDDRAVFDDAETIVANIAELHRWLTTEYPDLPVVLIGHGLGGMFAVRYAQYHQRQLAAIVLSGPILGTWHMLDLLECEQIPQTPIEPSMLSRDPAVDAESAADPRVEHGAFRRAALRDIDRSLERINDGPQLTIPALWLHGEDDEIVPEADTRTGIDRIRGREFYEHVYAGARHELFNETNKAEVVRDVVTFVRRKVLPS